jgi:hypothetical protein
MTRATNTSRELTRAIRGAARIALLVVVLGYAAADAQATVAPGPYNGPRPRRARSSGSRSAAT